MTAESENVERARQGMEDSGAMRVERLLLVVAALLVWVHLVDHLIAGHGNLEGPLLLGAVTAATALAYPRLSARLQATISIALGSLWLAGGLKYHLLPMLDHGPVATAYTGLGITVAGLLLIVAGIRAGLRWLGSSRAAAEPRIT